MFEVETFLHTLQELNKISIFMSLVQGASSALYRSEPLHFGSNYDECNSLEDCGCTTITKMEKMRISKTDTDV